MTKQNQTTIPQSDPAPSADRGERVVLFELTLTLSLIVFLFVNAYTRQNQAAIIALSAALALIPGLMLLVWLRRETMARHIFGTAIAALYVFAVVHGGYEHTGLIWSFLTQALLYQQFRARTAFGLNLAVLLMCAVLFYTPVLDGIRVPYTPIYESRYLILSFILAGMYFMFNRNRESLEARLLTANKALFDLSMVDELTRMRNRRYVHHYFSHLDVDRREDAKGLVTVMLIDIDHFKRVNDQFGHHCGDDVLVGVSAILREELRQSDVVARWGGEEFLVLMQDSDPESCLAIAEKLRERVAAHTFYFGKEEFTVTVSVGCISVDWKETSLERAIMLADDRLYEAKNRGRNQVVGDTFAAKVLGSN